MLISLFILSYLYYYLYLCAMIRKVYILFNLKITQMVSKKKISTAFIKVLISVVISVLTAVGVLNSDVAGVVTTAVNSVVVPDSI